MKNLYWSLLLLTSLSGKLALADDYKATIDFSPRIQLSVPVSGVIQTVNVVTGQTVTKGDVLLSLDPLPFKAEKQLAQSRVDALQTISTESKRDLKHKQELFDRTVLSLVELQDAELRDKRDAAQLESARVKLSQAVYDFDSSRLIAPFDALVLSVQVNQGQFVNNSLHSTALLTLVHSAQYQAKFHVPPEGLGKLAIGKMVSIESRGKKYSARIASIDYQPIVKADAADKYFVISAIFSPQDNTMPVGDVADVHID
ncbi:MAG: efflux RND transporter periplasmic adaptor subunit [Gammaproteobacteria bacterium]|nr:efflux RND transporter periplasmic adaptor subunit [Gammaproteobacteria bacterium]